MFEEMVVEIAIFLFAVFLSSCVGVGVAYAEMSKSRNNLGASVADELGAAGFGIVAGFTFMLLVLLVVSHVR